ncbi:MAG: branched-chain amino acid ABC transporter permease [Actinocatenispora sp.]
MSAGTTHRPGPDGGNPRTGTGTGTGNARVGIAPPGRPGPGPSASPGRRSVRALPVLALVGVLVSVPFWLGSYPVSLLSGVLAFAVLAMSVSLLTGVTGLPTLGQAGYFGVGGYTAAIISTSVSTVGPVQLVAAAVLSAAVAAVTGLLAVRARGVTFLMLTLAIGELVETAASRWTSLTGGSDGYSAEMVRPFFGLPELRLDGLVYFYALGVALVLLAVVLVLVRSPFGLTLRGIRDNEARMRALGYPVTAHLLTAYTLAGALAGIGGGLWVSVQDYISPADAGFGTSALALLAVTIGGVRSIWGGCLGAAVVLLTRDYLGGLLGGHGPLLLGCLFVLAVYLLPRGIAGIRRRRRAGGDGDE